MRAFATPRVTRDVMPQCLIAEVTAFSKSEFQRSERVHSELKRRGGTYDRPGDHKGKGKGKCKPKATTPS